MLVTMLSCDSEIACGSSTDTVLACDSTAFDVSSGAFSVVTSVDSITMSRLTEVTGACSALLTNLSSIDAGSPFAIIRSDLDSSTFANLCKEIRYRESSPASTTSQTARSRSSNLARVCCIRNRALRCFDTLGAVSIWSSSVRNICFLDVFDCEVEGATMGSSTNIGSKGVATNRSALFDVYPLDMTPELSVEADGPPFVPSSSAPGSGLSVLEAGCEATNQLNGADLFAPTLMNSCNPFSGQK